ncbi:MAG: tryptophan 2,3-dioxygenase family protein [Pseudomonadota bacterium]
MAQEQPTEVRTREDWHRAIESPAMLDYGVYLACDQLLTCQKPLAELCNGDELQFQIVHQVEELWMKLIAYTLVDVIDRLREGETNRVLSLMGRVHRLQRLMIQQLDVLETMSPKEYQEVRLQLGNGSGQESPGFRILLHMPPDLWAAYKERYLDASDRTVDDVYDEGYAHDDAYMVAEALTEYDELFQIFRWRHLFLIDRSIGSQSKSLKGRPVEQLQTGARKALFPELWRVRSEMTDRWGGSYGVVRDSIA